jgi:hypothetical protein
LAAFRVVADHQTKVKERNCAAHVWKIGVVVAPAGLRKFGLRKFNAPEMWIQLFPGCAGFERLCARKK